MSGERCSRHSESLTLLPFDAPRRSARPPRPPQSLRLGQVRGRQAGAGGNAGRAGETTVFVCAAVSFVGTARVCDLMSLRFAL